MNYYNKAYNQFNVINYCRKREFAMIPKIRALKVHCIPDFLRVLDLVHWDKNKPKLYRSVAKLKDIPQFTFNMSKRSSETSEWFTNEFDALIYEYDLFFDFDCDDPSKINNALDEVKILASFLDEYQIPYYVLFSGNKGFHLYIDGKYLPKPTLENGSVQPHKKIQENIKEAFQFKYLDLRNNGVGNRLCKIPYSLCPCEDNDFEEGMNVVLPLSKEQMENFNLENMKLRNVINQVRPLNRRGLIERFENLSEDEKKLNVANFIKSISI